MSLDINTPIAVDLQINAEQILPFHSRMERVINRHAVIINNGVVIDVLPQKEAERRYQAKDKVSLTKQILFPGILNSYCSLGASAFHHIGQDLPLSFRLQNHLKPLQEKYLSEELVALSSELSLAQMFKSGTTSFYSNYPFEEQSAKIAYEHQITANFFCQLNNHSTNHSFEQQLAHSLQLRDNFKHKAGIDFGVSVTDIGSLETGKLNKISAICNELALKLKVSLAPSPLMTEQSKSSSSHQVIRLLSEHALLSPDLLLTDIYHLNQREERLLAKTKTHCSISPRAQLLQATALSPVAALEKLDANISLGSNNFISSNLNLLQEVQLLAWLTKLEAQMAQSFSAESLLSFAIPNQELNQDAEPPIGAIAPGFKADLAAIETGSLLHNDYDPFEQIVYTANHLSTSHLWVNGKTKVSNYKLTDIDESYILKSLKSWQQKFING